VPPVLSTRVEVPSGGVRTVTVAGRFADLDLLPLTDDLSAPPAGSSRVRVLAAAGAVTAVDVAVRGGPVLATELPLGAAGDPRTVPAGSATLTVRGDGGTAAEVPMSFAAGSVVTLVVLDDPGGGLTVRPVLDAAGAAVIPAGGVEAGTGALPGAPAALPLAGALLTALGTARRRWHPLLAVTALVMAVGVATPASGTESAYDTGAVAVAAVAGQAAPPVRLVVPAAGVDAAVTGAGLDTAGALVPPADPAVAGWYTGGPAPGATGPAVITGHVDWAGAPGVFAGLPDLGPGAEILVGRSDGSTARFTVTRVVRSAKRDFPVAEVYGPTSFAELRLITCGGAFDRSRGSYEDNVIVFARLR
jgi:hypothetical protein